MLPNDSPVLIVMLIGKFSGPICTKSFKKLHCIVRRVCISAFSCPYQPQELLDFEYVRAISPGFQKHQQIIID
jgi:hypothetical protein